MVEPDGKVVLLDFGTATTFDVISADGKPIDPAKNYVVAGWASVNEGTEGPAAYDLVAQYIEREKVVKVPDNDTVKVIGA